MIKCGVCIEMFRRRVNRKNTGFSYKPSTADIDSYIEEACHIWQKAKTRKAEVDSEERNDLRQLEIKNKELDLTVLDKKVAAKIPKDYYGSLSYGVYASKEGCDCEKKLVTHIVQSDDLAESLEDPFRKPSFEYGEILVDEAGDSLIFYTNGEFKLTKVTANYYRKIIPPKCPSKVEGKKYYIDASGSKIDTDIDFEIDSTYILTDMIDIAVWVYLRDISDNNEADTQLKKIQSKYKLDI